MTTARKRTNAIILPQTTESGNVRTRKKSSIVIPTGFVQAEEEHSQVIIQNDTQTNTQNEYTIDLTAEIDSDGDSSIEDEIRITPDDDEAIMEDEKTFNECKITTEIIGTETRIMGRSKYTV